MACRRRLRLAGNQERLGHQRTDDAGLARTRNVQTFQGGVIPHRIGRIAMRDLPQDFTPVKADRADAAVRRLHDRKALNGESTTATAFAAGTARTAAARTAGGGSGCWCTAPARGWVRRRG